MLMEAFEGTPWHLSGEELGQLETVMKFEDSTDPAAIRYCRCVKAGRCRTPMSGTHKAGNAGSPLAHPHGGLFPLKAPQFAPSLSICKQAQNDSVLHFFPAKRSGSAKSQSLH